MLWKRLVLFLDYRLRKLYNLINKPNVQIKELEAGGDRMGDEVTKMLQAYGVMEKENR